MSLLPSLITALSQSPQIGQAANTLSLQGDLYTELSNTASPDIAAHGIESSTDGAQQLRYLYQVTPSRSLGINIALWETGDGVSHFDLSIVRLDITLRDTTGHNPILTHTASGSVQSGVTNLTVTTSLETLSAGDVAAFTNITLSDSLNAFTASLIKSAQSANAKAFQEKTGFDPSAV